MKGLGGSASLTGLPGKALESSTEGFLPTIAEHF